MATATNKISDRKKELVDIAVKIFLEKGVAQTSMRDLARAIGVTTGSLYHHFRSRDEVIDFVVQRTTMSVDLLTEYRGNLGNVKPTQALRECLNYWFRLNHASKLYSVFWVREARIFGTARYYEPMQKVSQGFMHFFEDLIREGVQAGEFEAKNPTIVAFNIWALAQEWGLRKWVRELFTIDDFVEQQTEAVLKQLALTNGSLINRGETEFEQRTTNDAINRDWETAGKTVSNK